jgi:hypothetical protein
MEYTVMEDKQFYGYRIIESIHKSNRYNICRAYNKEGYTVALKIADETFFTENPQLIDEAYRKAEAMRAVSIRFNNSLRFVRVLDTFKTDKVFFIVMTLIDGITLETALAQMSLPRNRADLEEIENQLSETVRIICNLGYRPAEIDASNVIVTPRDTVVLLNYIDLAQPDEDAAQSTVNKLMDKCYRKLSSRNNSAPYDIQYEPLYDSYSNSYPDSDPYYPPPPPMPSVRRMSDNAIVTGLGIITVMALIAILLIFIIGR